MTPDGTMTGRILVVGGTGRLGRLLRPAWDIAGQGHPVWQARTDAPRADQVFDPLGHLSAYADAARGANAILNLAGVVAGSEGELAANTPLALAALDAARAAGVSHVLIASSAAVYGTAPPPLTEASTVAPASPYGAAKLAMERAVADWLRRHPDGPRATILRIGNVAGADMLLGGAREGGPVVLDLFPDGHGPARSYIGPVMLARVLARLIGLVGAGMELPPILNVALPGMVTMDALLDAAQVPWQGRPAPGGVPPELRLVTTHLEAFVRFAPEDLTAAAIVADLAQVVRLRP